MCDAIYFCFNHILFVRFCLLRWFPKQSYHASKITFQIQNNLSRLNRGDHGGSSQPPKVSFLSSELTLSDALMERLRWPPASHLSGGTPESIPALSPHSGAPPLPSPRPAVHFGGFRRRRGGHAVDGDDARRQSAEFRLRRLRAAAQDGRVTPPPRCSFGGQRQHRAGVEPEKHGSGSSVSLGYTQHRQCQNETSGHVARAFFFCILRLLLSPIVLFRTDEFLPTFFWAV